MHHTPGVSLACVFITVATVSAGSPPTGGATEASQKPAAAQANLEQVVKNAPSADAALQMVKSLAGEWEGKTATGQPVLVSFRTISNGTCVEETLRTPDATDMVSVYCPDRGGLMMTHYCAANNQPRMRARTGGDPGRLEFDFVDATNLDSPAIGHMHRLVLSFPDRDHFTQEWTWMEHGKEGSEIFRFQRSGS
ncbi:MAG: hypothetical protein HY510_06475 [Acidobacteria bacterium]|nr:hypothetical protein [Acidobacteriota bacterium]